MSKICIICKEPYIYATYDDPGESCLCGERAWGTLWEWDKHRAYIKRFRFILAQFFYNLGSFLIYLKWPKSC